MALYDTELSKALEKIRESKARSVCIQLPDGMKPYAQDICHALEKEGCQVLIWLGSNFGACDIPLGLNRMGVDLLLSWGHNRFRKEEGWMGGMRSAEPRGDVEE
jgi:diphthamide biosynthesis enzyme Dph1/Dph2-like protein